MKGSTNHNLGRTFAVGIALLALAHASVSQCQAQITLTDGNATAIVDPTSQLGMFHWDVQGQNQLRRQWFWYGVGAGAVHSIDTISAPTVTLFNGTRGLTTSYVNPANFRVTVDYLLTGGAVVGPGQVANADIGESIRIDNLSNTTLPFHFYQYSYFNLNGANTDTVQLGTNVRGKFNDALQSDGVNGLSETVTTPGADHGEVNLFNNGVGDTLAKLNSGAAVTLGPPFFAGPLGPGPVTWALQWDLLIAPGTSAIISKDKYLSILIVPEPSALALIGLGVVGLVFLRRGPRD